MDRVIVNKGRKWRSLFVVLGLSLVLVFAYFFTLSFRESSFRIQADRVQVATVAKGPFEEYISVNGTVDPLKTLIVVALESGIVQEKFVEDGARTQEGEVLFKLSNGDLQLDYMNRETALLDQLNNLRNTQINLEQNSYQYQQQLIELETQLRQAELAFRSADRLYRDSVISGQEYELSRSTYMGLKNRFALLQKTGKEHLEFKSYQQDQLVFSSNLIRKSLESLRGSLANLEVRAPAAGLLTGFQVETGQHINKGQKVAEVDLMQGYRLFALIDEIYINRISKGLKATVEFDGKTWFMHTEKIYPQVQNGQFRVDLVFDTLAPKGLKYGQNLSIRLSLGEPAPALLLKRGGFYQKTGGSWVFVLEGNKALKRSTSFGRQNPDFFEIQEGLNEGDQVIISSYDIFGDAEVIVLE